MYLNGGALIQFILLALINSNMRCIWIGICQRTFMDAYQINSNMRCIWMVIITSRLYENPWLIVTWDVFEYSSYDKYELLIFRLIVTWDVFEYGDFASFPYKLFRLIVTWDVFEYFKSPFKNTATQD